MPSRFRRVRYPRFSYGRLGRGRRRRSRWRRRRRRFRRFRRGLRSRFICHKFLFSQTLDITMNTNAFEIAPRLNMFEQAFPLLKMYRRYRIRGINVRYRSGMRGAIAAFSSLGHACVRLGCIPIAYSGEMDTDLDGERLRLKGFYREYVLQRDFALNRKTLIVNGATGSPSRNPWLSDPDIPHYGLYFRYINLSPEFISKCPVPGKLFLTAYIEFRDRRLLTR